MLSTVSWTITRRRGWRKLPLTDHPFSGVVPRFPRAVGRRVLLLWSPAPRWGPGSKPSDSGRALRRASPSRRAGFKRSPLLLRPDRRYARCATRERRFGGLATAGAASPALTPGCGPGRLRPSTQKQCSPGSRLLPATGQRTFHNGHNMSDRPGQPPLPRQSKASSPPTRAR